MTVDLSTLNRISAEVFLNCKIQGQPLQKFLQTKYQQLKKSLAKSKITLQSVTFLECRGLAIEFKGTSILTLRQDFATDDNGVLYSVSSYFDKVNKLKKLNLRNLKANIEEQFIF